jgi:hypothetical protein
MTGSFRADLDDAHQVLSRVEKNVLEEHRRERRGRHIRQGTLLSGPDFSQAATALDSLLCLHVPEARGGHGQSSRQRRACTNYGP